MNTDKITLDRINTAHPALRSQLLTIYKEVAALLTNKRVMLRFTSVLRTHAQQDALYAQGRTAPGPVVTWVKGGGSYHNYGMAVDIVILMDRDGNGTFETASWDVAKDWDADGTPDWKEIVAVFERYEWQWGVFNRRGKRIDLPHFQRTLGYTTRQLAQMPKDAQGYPVLPQ